MGGLGGLGAYNGEDPLKYVESELERIGLGAN